ncbi:MAG: hypothetical protein AAGD01_08925 [Acidobacteriota bacterium]
MPPWLDYLLLFVVTGSTAVGVKALANVERFYWTGIIAMLPVKTTVAFLILYREAGARGIQAAMPGMWAGTAALVVLLGSLVWMLRRLHPVAAIALSLVLWTIAVLVARRWLA